MRQEFNVSLSHLELQDNRLHSLLELTNAINANLAIDQLYRIFTFIMKEQLKFSRFALLMASDEWELAAKSGYKAKINPLDLAQELQRFRDITLVESSNSTHLKDFQAVIPIFHQERALAFLLLATSGKTESLEPQHFSFAQTITNILSVAVENRRLTKQNLVKERISKELELASEMQKLLFPQELPSNKKMDLSGRYIPRHAIGGDYYDFIPLGDEEYIICIGDVSGKGITAAMLMANFQATIRTLFKYQRFEMSFLMEELNKLVMKSAKGEKFITFFIAHYNAYSRQLTYVNAGHNQPFVLHGKNVTLLTEGCIGLGMLDELPYVNVGKLILQPKTTIVLFTDGVVELENEIGEAFGLEQLIKHVKAFAPLKMEDMNNLIFSKLEEWKGNLPYVDDTAIFSCKFF
ncbi:MAG: PP2C family protein-serine/threonine phosphatase [Flavobacteriales bacterium]